MIHIYIYISKFTKKTYFLFVLEVIILIVEFLINEYVSEPHNHDVNNQDKNNPFSYHGAKNNPIPKKFAKNGRQSLEKYNFFTISDHL